MVKKSKHKPAQPGSFYLEHRYMDGLRFDGVWTYLARNRVGAWRWKALPLPEAPSAWIRRRDPQGAWWCVRQCAAVMNPSAVPPRSLVNTPIPHPDPVSLAQALQTLLPDCSIQVREYADAVNQTMDIAATVATEMTRVLQAGGCALLRLEGGANTDRSPRVRWVWMVGIEAWLHALSDRPIQGAMISTGTDSTIHALLVVSPHWPAPWGGGFGAKVRPQADGSWRLASADGEVMHCRVTACIAVLPAVPAAYAMPVSPVAKD